MNQSNPYILSRTLGELLMERRWMLALAESCTGGQIAQEITNVSGASTWFDRGFVTYTNTAKVELLAVPEITLAQYGAVSAQTAEAMALGALQNSQADISLSVTGVAGPLGGSFEKPVGLVWFGMAYDGKAHSTRQHLSSGRKHIRDCATAFGLAWLIETLRGLGGV